MNNRTETTEDESLPKHYSLGLLMAAALSAPAMAMTSMAILGSGKTSENAGIAGLAAFAWVCYCTALGRRAAAGKGSKGEGWLRLLAGGALCNMTAVLATSMETIQGMPTLFTAGLAAQAASLTALLTGLLMYALSLTRRKKDRKG